MEVAICINHEDQIYIFAILIISSMYARSTGFFDKDYYGFDSCSFMYIGYAMKHGYVPYKDLFDIKGPMLWLIQYTGQMIYEGRYGIHMIEIFNFCGINLFTYFIARFYLGKKASFGVVIIMLVFWSGILETGNAVEEFSALGSIVAIYVTIRNLHSGDSFSKKRWFALYGIFFMYTTLLLLWQLNKIIIIQL